MIKGAPRFRQRDRRGQLPRRHGRCQHGVPLDIGKAQQPREPLDILLDATAEPGETERHAGLRQEPDQPRKGSEIGDPAEDHPEDAGILHDARRLGRPRCDDQPAHLLPDPLRRKPPQPVAGPDRRRQALRVESTGPEFGIETEEAEDTQPVLRNPLTGVADEADASRHDVRIAAEGVMDGSRRIDRQRVDREIASTRVGLPVPAEANHRMAAVGLDVLAERRHLEAGSVDDEGHRAVLDAGRNGFDAGRLGAAGDLLRQERCREVDVADRHAGERVADGAADDPRRLVALVEDGEDRPDRRSGKPAGPDEIGKRVVHRCAGSLIRSVRESACR